MPAAIRSNTIPALPLRLLGSAFGADEYARRTHCRAIGSKHIQQLSNLNLSKKSFYPTFEYLIPLSFPPIKFMPIKFLLSHD